jgi:hydroxymethylpyrimidine pyrophosphatase-like HAD family hydrolase
MEEAMRSRARKLITEPCLIAADVDKTILAQVPDHEAERHLFFRVVAPLLVDAARLGAHVAFVTGNSMHELCTRVLRALLKQMEHSGDLPLLSRFHFFCNSGGVYFHFPEGAFDASGSSSGIWKRLTSDRSTGDTTVNPRFIHTPYLDRTLIAPADLQPITNILQHASALYLADVRENVSEYDNQYDLTDVTKDGEIIGPTVDMRLVDYFAHKAHSSGAVQVTLKPILSFRHARPGLAPRLYEADIRTSITKHIQAEMDNSGLGRYVARPGGRGSIDVTLQRLDKAYALEFLIDHLRVEGTPRKQQQFGSNTIYFGDEVVIGGGNDYAVTRLPGVLVFAVNPDKELVPFISQVVVPSAIFEGPDATAQVLGWFNRCARDLLAEYREGQPAVMTAIEALKHQYFTNRIEQKIGDLKRRQIPVDDWATLHTLVTLMSRDDPAARRWLSLLVEELDGIMTQLGTANSSGKMPAQGTSHPH